MQKTAKDFVENSRNGDEVKKKASSNLLFFHKAKKRSALRSWLRSALFFERSVIALRFEARCESALRKRAVSVITPAVKARFHSALRQRASKRALWKYDHPFKNSRFNPQRT
jgi:hypothetical protein